MKVIYGSSLVELAMMILWLSERILGVCTVGTVCNVLEINASYCENDAVARRPFAKMSLPLAPIDEWKDSSRPEYSLKFYDICPCRGGGEGQCRLAWNSKENALTLCYWRFQTKYHTTPTKSITPTHWKEWSGNTSQTFCTIEVSFFGLLDILDREPYGARTCCRLTRDGAVKDPTGPTYPIRLIV